MEFDTILVVCVGNICRSPLGERMLAAKIAERGLNITVSSAGIAALQGHSADKDAAAVALAHNVSLDGHVARQYTHEIGASHALILVMEAGHKHEIVKTAPNLLSRIMLFDQWTDAMGVPDPYGRSSMFHEQVFVRVEKAANAWVHKLEKSTKVKIKNGI